MAIHLSTLKRAALPEVMLREDVELALQVGPNTARLLLRSGRLGPTFRVGRKLGVLRDTFLAALAGPPVGRHGHATIHAEAPHQVPFRVVPDGGPHAR